ncbi:MAG: Lrp/AsnC family transcriptional regulator [Candidatus Woesearchaeota archaeon]
MHSFDVKDRKILYYLSKNSRMSHTELSRLVKLSKNAVKYRIERLQKEGVITKFAAVVNIGALGLTTVALLLRFNEDIYEHKEIIEYFRNHPMADWVISLSGHWDLFVELIVSDFDSLSAIIKDITTKFSTSLNTYQMFVFRENLRVEHLISEFYQDLDMEEQAQAPRTRGIHEIDNTDKQILQVLNLDSSTPYLQIAQQLGLTIDVVRYRIKNLVNKGIIIKFFSEISLRKLGYQEYLYTIRLKDISSEKMNQIQQNIRTNPNITYAFLDMTSFNIIFVCAFKTSEGIDKLSRDLRKQYSRVIEKQDYLIIKEQILFNLFPRGLVD